MNRSLSIILPVRNVERLLAARVQEIIEAVAELSDDLEIVIIDDGSTDGTEEVAAELARTFPQITTVRHASQLGPTAAADLGVQQSRGDVILIHNVDVPLSHEALRKLWSMRDDEELVIASSEASGQPSAGGKRSWMDVGTKLLRRQAINELRPAYDAAMIINRVTRTDLEESPLAPTTMPSRGMRVEAE